jgi:hypothetical protein
MTFMKNFNRRFTTLIMITAILLAWLIALPSVALAAGKVTHRPLSDFLSTQGTYCIDDDHGGCLLFVPPDPNFLGWTSDFDKSPVLFAGVDYAGLANAYLATSGPQFAGSITERPLADGRAEVKVSLHTSNANIWIIELDLSPGADVLAQIAGNAPALFGHRPANVLAGAGQALAYTLLEVSFINDAPGAPLPDLVQLANFPDTLPHVQLQMLKLVANATGPLTADFGVAEGTPGRCTIVQTGLIAHSGRGRALEDAYPAEMITCRPVGH